MPVWGEDGQMDPDFASGVKEAFGSTGRPKGGRRIQKFFDVVREGWAAVIEGATSPSPLYGIADQEDPQSLDETITDFLEDYRDREPDMEPDREPDRGPDMAGGEKTYGASVEVNPNEARPGIRPTAPSGASPAGASPATAPSGASPSGASPDFAAGSGIVFRGYRPTSSPEEQDMQELLIKAGYSVGDDGADGYAGPDTVTAMNQFLRDLGMPELKEGDEVPSIVLELLREESAQR